jgi:cytoskeleton protein RodZ
MVEQTLASVQGAAPDSTGAAPQGAATAGAWLRAAREASGMHIGALSVSLKVPVTKLEALEADRLDLLPDAVFARALASSVCRALKLDPAEVLRLLPQSKAPNMEFAARPAAATVPVRMSDAGKMRLSRVSRPVAVGAALLVLAAVVLLLYPSFQDMAGEVDEIAAPLLSPGVPAEPSAPQPDNAQAPGAGVVETPVPSAASGTGTLPATAPAAVPAPAAPAPAVVSPSPPPASATDILRITAKGASWVQVTDATGATPLRRELAAGESLVFAGALPLSVVVGRVDAVDVQVRGAAFDMAPVARNNTARFQVK